MPDLRSAARSSGSFRQITAGVSGTGNGYRSHGIKPHFFRGKWLAIAYALFGLILFVAFLTANFPYGDTISSMLKPFKLKLAYQDQRMSPPIGAKLENVRLISTADQPNQLLLRSPGVILAPTIGSLLFGRPGLRIDAEIYDGTVSATVHQRAGITDVAFGLEDLSLAQSEPLRELGATFSGRVFGSGSAELRGPEISDNTGHLKLDGRDITVKIVNGFPPVNLGTITGDAILDNGVLALHDIEAHGADAEIRTEGTIQLASDFRESIVDLTVSLAPTRAGRDHFGLFLNMLPHTPAAGPYHVSGTLMSPSVN